MDKLTENQVVVDWDFNTGFMVIQIQPFSINLRDCMKEKDGNYHNLGPKEAKAREKMEKIKKRILSTYNKGL